MYVSSQLPLALGLWAQRVTWHFHRLSEDLRSQNSGLPSSVVLSGISL